MFTRDCWNRVRCSNHCTMPCVPWQPRGFQEVFNIHAVCLFPVGSYRLTSHWPRPWPRWIFSSWMSCAQWCKTFYATQGWTRKQDRIAVENLKIAQGAFSKSKIFPKHAGTWGVPHQPKSMELQAMWIRSSSYLDPFVRLQDVTNEWDTLALSLSQETSHFNSASVSECLRMWLQIAWRLWKRHCRILWGNENSHAGWMNALTTIRDHKIHIWSH